MPTTLFPKKSDVIIHPLKAPEKTAGGLYKSKYHEKKVAQGIIVAVGSEAAEKGFETAQHVVFNPYSGDEVAVEDGGWFFVIHWDFVEAILINSDVRLISTDSVKRIIEERIGELKLRKTQPTLDEIEASLNERIDSYVVSEGFQWGF